MVTETLSPDLVGTKFEPVQISWTQKDTMLYALGVGAKPADELNFLYEGKGPLVLPTYAVIPGMRALGNIRQAVKLKLQRLLHGEQGFELLRPLPANAEITLHSEISEVWDKGKAGVIAVTATAEDKDGPLFKSYSSLFYIGGGGFGGEPGPSSRDKNVPPAREPDFVVKYETLPEQGAIYRLSGDLVPLHIDPEFAASAGYDKPFMHGLCTYGFVGRAALACLCDGDPARFKSMTGRFAERVQFEDTIVTKIWKTDDGEAIIKAEDQNGVVVLSQAKVTYSEP
ncbi:MAG: MaoC/PaaZ C-terminal domain-containing protein [Pseudomonadales bacterium]|jgi:acyl dehydratase